MRGQQHNSNDSRNCWGTARERNRIRARYAIRQRVLLLGEDDGCDDDDAPPAGGAPDDPNQPKQPAEIDCQIARKERIQEILHRIVQGDRSFFSLTFMEEHHAVLSTAFPAQYLWQDGVVESKTCLLCEQKLLSWFGKQGVEQMEQFLQAQETWTFFDYAVYLKRYHVVGSLILGGIIPCIRGRLRIDCRDGENDMTCWRRRELSDDVGARVCQKFFSGVVPLSLSSYIVKRVVEMRRSAWEVLQHSANHAQDANARGTGLDENGCRECCLCSRRTPPDLELCFIDSNDEGASCGHLFCEPCLWNNIMECMDTRSGDVVLCPVCETMGGQNTVVADPHNDNVTELSTTPAERRRNARERYYSLPADSRELKKRKSKKKAVRECDVLCSTWAEAVKPSLGTTQSVRRDKFFAYVEKPGSIHFVKGCLDSGIDLSLQNEYGQTSLFIAVWRGDVELVQLLLHYGSDPSIAANGGMTCIVVAKAYKRFDIVDILLKAGVKGNAPGVGPMLTNILSSSSDTVCPSPPRIRTLIDWSSQHEGAGSFVLDDLLESSTIDTLIELWKVLPVAENAKKKNVLCSTRSYYCDAVGAVTVLLRSILTKAFDTSSITVLPHMRFLCYSHQGTELAPHVDLSRVDTCSGARSTHSFLLYLTTCTLGGETALLEDVTGSAILALAKPKRGRLLLFPHRCPHSGLSVESVPKLLIRGEVRLPPP